MTDTPSRPRTPAFHPAQLVLHVRRDTGRRGVVVSSPHLPGWAVTARGPVGLATALDEAWREAAVRAYAEQRAQPYDLTRLATNSRDRPVGTGRWEGPLEDGSWLSPSGRRYRAGAAILANVRPGMPATRRRHSV